MTNTEIVHKTLHLKAIFEICAKYLMAFDYNQIGFAVKVAIKIAEKIAQS